MNIMSSANGSPNGFVEAVVGMTVTVDAYKGDDEELASWMDRHNDGVGQRIWKIDEDEDVLYVRGCPHKIEPWLVWKDI